LYAAICACQAAWSTETQPVPGVFGRAEAEGVVGADAEGVAEATGDWARAAGGEA
jgi:hypothetical protein